MRGSEKREKVPKQREGDAHEENSRNMALERTLGGEG